MKKYSPVFVILNIKAEHPFWGYRRVWAYLKYRQNIVLNHKRVYLLVKKHNLLVKPNTRLKAIRANAPHRSKPRATRPNQYWGIDMTKVMVSSFGGCTWLLSWTGILKRLSDTH
ncbi:MAG: IS3 family transposase [Candidatus Scalinduaceae bacterium]